MDKHDWTNLDDAQLEAALTADLGADVPDDVVTRVNPWGFALREVLLGMALCTFTLNVWCLNYILPFLGMVLTMLGFRTLRRGNRWLGRCFALAAARLTIKSLTLVVDATILFETALPWWSKYVLIATDQLILFTLLYCLWHGLRDAQREAGLPPDAQGIEVLAIWYVLLLVLVALPLDGWIVFIVLTVLYILTLRSLFRLSDELAEAGYLLQATPVRISDRTLALLLSAAVLVACALGALFESRYAMDWQEVSAKEHTQVQEERAKLIALGFPEEVLGDLTAEDIARCGDAVQVIADTTYSYLDGAKLYITGVGVRLDDDAERWVIIRHFRWADDATFCGTETLRIRSDKELMPLERCLEYGPSGRVLYDKDGHTYASGYEHLALTTYSYTDFFGEKQTQCDILGAFSLPRQGESCRGYVAYSVSRLQGEYRAISSWLEYGHQVSLLQYPMQTAYARQRAGTLHSSRAFATMQDFFELRFTDGEARLVR